MGDDGEEEEDDEDEEEEVQQPVSQGAKKRPSGLPEPPAKKAKGSDGKAAPFEAADFSADAHGPAATPAKDAAAGKTPDFIPSPKFKGSKPGMVYKKDVKGLGYYKDVKPVASPGGARVPGQPKKPSADEWASNKVDAMAWKVMGGGLKFRDTVQGAGTPIRKGMSVQMHYTGKLTKNGRQFDSSKGRKPLTFRYGAGEVIK